MIPKTAIARSLRRASLGAAIVALATVAGCNVGRSGDRVDVQPVAPPKGLYEDLGPADKASELRALIALPLRDAAGLTATIDALYDPTSSSFRRYLTPAELLAAHAPKEADVAVVSAWLAGHGFEVPFVATNRVLIEFTGTIAAFEAAFDTEVHIFLRSADATTSRDTLFAPGRPLTVPAAIASRIDGVLTIDPVAETDPIAADVPKDPGPLPADGPALAPSAIRERYGFAPIPSRGEGQAIGVVAGFSFKPTDARAFWRTFGIDRSDPEIVRVAEPASSRNVETALDVEWAGALAPGARLVVYEAPDVKDTALVFALNEAVGRAEVSVVTDSFSRRETSVSRALAEQYEITAQMAAALGITLVAASGDSNAVELPARDRGRRHGARAGRRRDGLGQGRRGAVEVLRGARVGGLARRAANHPGRVAQRGHALLDGEPRRVGPARRDLVREPDLRRPRRGDERGAGRGPQTSRRVPQRDPLRRLEGPACVS